MADVESDSNSLPSTPEQKFGVNDNCPLDRGWAWVMLLGRTIIIIQWVGRPTT